MNIIKIFTKYKLFEILILGMISGMPLAIIFSTLSIWLKEASIDIALITTFSVARLPYSLKIFWAPLVDCFKAPLLGKFGHRKSWLILCTIFTSLTIFAISRISPASSLGSLYFLTILLGIFSATFDISVDALRIEKLNETEQAAGGSIAILGHKLGMLITGAGALYFTHISNNWSQTFLAISIILALSIIFIITVKEDKIIKDRADNFSISFFQQLFLAPLKDFLSKEKALAILLSIIFFKLGDAMLGVVSGPFYIELGYTKEQIAVVVKIYGLIATILGSIAGGIVVYKIGNFKGLIATGIAQSLTHFAFMWLNHQELHFTSLLVAISIENFACGMGSAALVVYISSLCNKKYTGTQYALLSSSASLCNNTITIYGGSLVKILGWDNFFILTVILALPGIVILMYLNDRFSVKKI